MNKKYLVRGLMSVYGLGSFMSNQICCRLGFQDNFRLKNMSEEQIFNLSQCVDELKLPIKGELQRWLKFQVDKLVSIKLTRGIRHRQGLPVRGQRTHTNARTRKRAKFFK